MRRSMLMDDFMLGLFIQPKQLLHVVFAIAIHPVEIEDVFPGTCRFSRRQKNRGCHFIPRDGCGGGLHNGALTLNLLRSAQRDVKRRNQGRMQRFGQLLSALQGSNACPMAIDFQSPTAAVFLATHLVRTEVLLL